MAHDIYLPTLQALRAQMRELDEQRNRIMQAISAIENLPAPLSKNGSASTRTVATDDDPSYPEATLIVLREAGEALHIDQIANRMRQHGWFEDKDFINTRSHRNSLIGSLDRKARDNEVFFKPKAATYGLLEWQGMDDREDKTPAPDDAGAGADPNLWRE